VFQPQFEGQPEPGTETIVLHQPPKVELHHRGFPPMGDGRLSSFCSDASLPVSNPTLGPDLAQSHTPRYCASAATQSDARGTA
jgi:hypothetical protein